MDWSNNHYVVKLVSLKHNYLIINNIYYVIISDLEESEVIMKLRFQHRISLIVALLLLAFIPNRSMAQNKSLSEMTISELMDVKVVTASTRYQNLTEAPATIYVITEDDIKQYGYRDLKNVLQQLPGIECAYPQSHIHDGQRGFSGNWSQTKLLINGIQANLVFSGEVYIASLYPLYNVKQIEIIQGPASVLYGADAFTGVINIITKNSDNTEKGSDLSSFVGGMDKVMENKQVSFNIIIEKKRLGMTMSGTIFNLEGSDFTDFLRTAEYTEINRQVRNEMFDSGNPYRDDNRAYVANANMIYSINDNSKF